MSECHGNDTTRCQFPCFVSGAQKSPCATCQYSRYAHSPRDAAADHASRATRVRLGVEDSRHWWIASMARAGAMRIPRLLVAAPKAPRTAASGHFPRRAAQNDATASNKNNDSL